jgi:hypothetical protein
LICRYCGTTSIFHVGDARAKTTGAVIFLMMGCRNCTKFCFFCFFWTI